MVRSRWGSFYTQPWLDHCVRTSVRVTDFYPQPLSLKRFIESLNRHQTTIKFTATWSAEKVTFLDTTVYLKEDGLISTDMYVKPMDKQLYLRKDSCYPKHCKASIPFSQALRLR